jgi:hypothetical protein
MLFQQTYIDTVPKDSQLHITIPIFMGKINFTAHENDFAVNIW